MLTDAQRQRNAHIKRLRRMGWKVVHCTPDEGMLDWHTYYRSNFIGDASSNSDAWNIAIETQAKWAVERSVQISS